MGLLTRKTGAGQLAETLDAATENLRDFVQQNIISGDQRDLDRVTKYHLYWHFYENKHWKEYNHSLLSFNYVGAFIDKVSQFLLGKESFTFKVRSYSTPVVDPEIKKSLEGIVNRCWNKNSKVLTSYEMLQMGSITGDLWCSIEWVKDKKECKIKTLDSRHCFPEFSKDDPMEIDGFMYRLPLKDHPEGYKVKVFRYTEEKIETWYQKTTSKSTKDQLDRKLEAKEENNTFGFIPIVHIKNKPKSNGYFSSSDAENIMKLNKVYNELTQEVKSIIDYYSAPTTVITGATMKNLKRGLGNVWSGLPSEANVFNLGLDADLSSANQFLDRLKTAMHEMSDVPENFLGKIQPISNTSAAALQLTYQPIIQQADLKWMTYGQGITELNDMAIIMHQKFNTSDPLVKKIPKDFDQEYEVIPHFSYGFPRDRQLELSVGQQELAMRVNSREGIMERLGHENVPELLDQINEDLLNQADIDSQINQIVTPVTSPDSGILG